MDPALLALVSCPRCGGPVRVAGKGSECRACQIDFPDVGGIPCLFAEPGRRLDEWRRAAERFIDLLEGSVAQLDEHLKRLDLLASTRGRLTRQRDGHRDNGERLRALFRGAGLWPQGRTKASEQEQPLIEYYEHILRDWAWEAAGAGGGQPGENARAAELVTASLGADTRLGKVLVLGAGPCRLAYDLHQRFSPELTVALDINPLLLLAARQVMFGGGLSLYEFPNDPSGLDAVSIDHQMRAPAGVPERLFPVLGDAFAAPFGPGSFDTVVTPWFIDIVPVDLRESIALVHRLLAPGGRWLNYGPLSYPTDHVHAQRYSKEELYELVRLGAFAFEDAGQPRVTSVDFMRSPSSARRKIADVISFAARKQPLPEAYPAAGDPPPWLVLAHLPIPRFAGLDAYRPEHPMLKYLIGLIDGRRTAADVAARMVEDHGARPDAALNGTRAMLAVLIQSVRGEMK
jgi:SAM-dependent methyltransferase/uncharacterized protein YbaR (Trm112 family)